MKLLHISIGRSRLHPFITAKKVTWKKLAKRLLRYDVLDLSYDEYMRLDREQQSQHKDVGYFIGGRFRGRKRLLAEMRSRYCITLDLDHVDAWDLDAIQDAYADLEYVVHSTLKHSADTPRLRLVFPLAKAIVPAKYEPAARRLADRLGMDCFDDTSFQSSRIMFWPAVTADGEVYKHWNKGTFVDAQELLDDYIDWEDFLEWPHSSRVKNLRPHGKRAENPLTKQGIIGAFNRTFDIHAAITRFDLPYEPTECENRYRPVGATGPSGAVVYDDIFLYSHHESDAVSQQNVNAWDLVRLHKFGDKDGSDLDGVPVMQRPSSMAMAALAESIPEVRQELVAPAHEMDEVAEGKMKKKNLKQEADAGAGNPADPAERGEDGASGSEPDELPDDADFSFQGLHAEISALEPASSTVEECNDFLTRIAIARLPANEVDILAATLKDAYPAPKPSKQSLLKGITGAGRTLTGRGAGGSKGGPVDLERALLTAFLDEWYAGGRHLKRIGKRCWTYEQGLWALADDETVRGKLGLTFTRLRVERPDDMRELVAVVGEGKTSSLMKSTWQMLCDDLATKENRDDPLKFMRRFELPVINCRNCELYVDAQGRLKRKKHRPANFYTVRLDVDYDPDAECPEWDRFMGMVFARSIDPDDMVRHVEELGGYIVQMSRWLKTWVMLHGDTNTGKSTMATVLQLMLGKAYTGKPMSKLADSGAQFAEAGLIGKLLMVDDDFAYEGHLPDSFLKTYSEEKSVTASIKYGDDVNFRARALPMILSNHWPVTRDVTNAFIERALVIPFTRRIQGRDQDDQRQMRMYAELPGILNRFVKGLMRLRARGTWDRPMDCVEVERQWVARSNPAMAFLHECLEITGEKRDRIRPRKLYDVYMQWNAEQSGGLSRGGYAMKKGQFLDRMRAKLGRERKRGELFFFGVRFSSSVREEFSDIADEWDE